MSETVQVIRHWRCDECGGLASTSAHEDVCECGPCGREMGMFDLVVIEAERDRYRQIGDQMQSEASRLAAWVRGENLEMHWEAYLALAAVERCVRDWTAARSATTEERSAVPHDDSIDMEQLAGEMLTALGPYWHQQTSMTPMAAITKALAERDRSIQALAWAVDWIERIAEVPVPGTDEQEDWERFAAAQEILRTGATNQKEVGG